MNQILLTDNENHKKKNSKNHKGTNDMKKIIVFFGAVILIFGIVITGAYGYKTYNNNKEEEKVVGKPQLSLEEDSEEGKVTIIAKSNIGINKIIYTWNDEESEEIEANGSSSYEKMIDIPGGENNLKVKVIDQNGQEQDSEKIFFREEESKPVIETSIEENAKLKIIATDEIAMKYITYRWNNEQDIKVNVENEANEVIETTIDIKRGENKLTITAVNSKDNSQTIEKIFNGVEEPTFDIKRNGNKLYMKISHDMGFQKIEFSINGDIYTYDENFSGYDSTKKDIEYQIDLEEGETIVVILAISNEKTGEEQNSYATYRGKCTYTPE